MAPCTKAIGRTTFGRAMVPRVCLTVESIAVSFTKAFSKVTEYSHGLTVKHIEENGSLGKWMARAPWNGPMAGGTKVSGKKAKWMVRATLNSEMAASIVVAISVISKKDTAFMCRQVTAKNTRVCGTEVRNMV